MDLMSDYIQEKDDYIRQWEEWVQTLPEKVQVVAKVYTPFKQYRDVRDTEDCGNRYTPVSYEEEADGSVSITCHKSNAEWEVFGNYNVFGMKPENLMEA